MDTIYLSPWSEAVKNSKGRGRAAVRPQPEPKPDTEHRVPTE